MKQTAYDFIKNVDLSGKVYLVTGAYSGLGAITTKALLKANATVIVAGRNADSQKEFLKSIQSQGEINLKDNQIDVGCTLDLSNLASVRRFVTYVKEKYSKIECLVNNAGVMFTPPGKTNDGFEIQFGTNVIGHFLLAKSLVDITSRQVWLSSKAHTRLGAPRIDFDAITEVDESNYNTILRYQQSKLGNILLAKYFNEHYSNIVSVAVHPGIVKTNLGRHMPLSKKLLFMVKHPLAIFSMKEPEEGAATQVMVSIIPDSQLSGGAYYEDCMVSVESESARNMEDAKNLFEYCNQVTRKYQD